MSAEYPSDWPAIAGLIKAAAGWKCERCLHPDDRDSGHVLTVHHLDGDKANCADWNLAALCQRCHLVIQARVKMGQLFFSEILTVSDWFKPHLEGFLRAQQTNNERKEGMNTTEMGNAGASGMEMSRELNVIKDKELRRDIDAQLQKLKELPASRERALAITKLQEAVMWLGMDLKRLNEPNPYPNSKDPSNTKIEPTADGLKL